MRYKLSLILSILLFSSAVYSQRIPDLYPYAADKDGEVVYGYADTTMKMVIPAKYFFADFFYEGLAKVGVMQAPGLIRYGYIDRKGKLVIPFLFTEEPSHFNNGYAYGSILGVEVTFDKEGNVLSKFKNATRVSGKHEAPLPLNYFRITEGEEQRGVVNADGKLIVPPMYRHVNYKPLPWDNSKGVFIGRGPLRGGYDIYNTDGKLVMIDCLRVYYGKGDKCFKCVNGREVEYFNDKGELPELKKQNTGRYDIYNTTDKDIAKGEDDLPYDYRALINIKDRVLIDTASGEYYYYLADENGKRLSKNVHYLQTYMHEKGMIIFNDSLGHKGIMNAEGKIIREPLADGMELNYVFDMGVLRAIETTIKRNSATYSRHMEFRYINEDMSLSPHYIVGANGKLLVPGKVKNTYYKNGYVNFQESSAASKIVSIMGGAVIGSDLNVSVSVHADFDCFYIQTFRRGERAYTLYIDSKGRRYFDASLIKK